MRKCEELMRRISFKKPKLRNLPHVGDVSSFFKMLNWTLWETLLGEERDAESGRISSHLNSNSKFEIPSANPPSLCSLFARPFSHNEISIPRTLLRKSKGSSACESFRLLTGKILVVNQMNFKHVRKHGPELREIQDPNQYQFSQ
jgi:hypothetical protein